MPETVVRAAEWIAQGRLVAFPTETVYGLGARADQDAAVAAIFATKGRPADHPLIVHVAGSEDVPVFAQEIPLVAQRLMAAYWPGPLTLILRRRPGVATACAGGQDTIGIRCPAHPMARELLARAKALGVPGIAAPSANRFGRVSPTTAAHVADEFGDAVAIVDGGACEVGIESAIVDCSRGVPVLLRPGILSSTVLAEAAGVPLNAADATAPRASGTLESHYAPVAAVRLWTRGALVDELVRQRGAAEGMEQDQLRPAVALYASASVLAEARCGGAGTGVGALSLARVMPQGPEDAARDLFAGLRALDQALGSGGGEIWVEAPPQIDAWDGVRDRLRRASAGTVHSQRPTGQGMGHEDSDGR